jgi:hypothetical protein
MTEPHFDRLAADMRRKLSGSGSTEAVIKGTYIALSRREQRVQLHIGRRDAVPSPVDAFQIADAFAVPADTVPQRQVIRIASQDGHSIPVHCLRFSWIELDAASVPPPQLGEGVGGRGSIVP